MRTAPRRKCLLGQPNGGWDRRSFLGPLRAREETARKLRQWDSPIATALTIAPEPYALNHTGTACPPDRLQETEENRPAPVRPSGPTHEPSVTRCARHRRLGQASHVVRLKRRRAVGRNTHDGCATIRERLDPDFSRAERGSGPEDSGRVLSIDHGKLALLAAYITPPAAGAEDL
jgi:hypothetical protein